MHQPMVVERAPGAVGEHALVERARNGDRSAYSEIVAARLPSAVRLVRAIVANPADAEDITQDAFVQAWRTLPYLRDTAKFDAWFGRVLVNTARMHLRRHGRATTATVVALDVAGDSDRALGRLDPAVEGMASSDALRRAIDRLNPDDRMLLALHHFEDRPVSEVASIFGIPVGTAKWRLHQARAALKRAMETQR
jgi:RNA polymerase sigma-70 factor (ECF subfamily)